MTEYRYRCTKVVTEDYGDSPASGKAVVAVLAIIPDGPHWQTRPATLNIGVPLDHRPGSIWRVLIEEITAAKGD